MTVKHLQWTIYYVALFLIVINCIVFAGVSESIKALTQFSVMFMGIVSILFMLRSKRAALRLCKSMIVFCIMLIGVSAALFFSISYYKSLIALIMLWTQIIFIIVLAHSLSINQFVSLAKIITVLVTGLAVFGIIGYSLNRLDVLWYVKEWYRDRLTSTFINPNHFANLIALTIPLVLFFISTSQRLKKILFLLMLSVLIVALILTRSWGGMIASFSAIVFFVLVSFHKENFSRKKMVWIVPIVTVVIVFSVWAAYNSFAEKLYSFSTRMSLLSGILEYSKYQWIHSWWRLCVGFGIGTFALVYNAFHPVLTLYYQDMAHMELLHFFIECGLFCCVLFFIGLAFFLKEMKEFISSVKSRERLLAISLLSSIMAFLVHSLFDFVFHIQALTLVAGVIIAFIYTLSKEYIRIKDFKTCVLVMCVALSVFSFFSVRNIWAEFNHFRATREARYGFDERREYIDMAIESMPFNEKMLYTKGALLIHQALDTNDQRYAIKAIDVLNDLVAIGAEEPHYRILLADAYELADMYAEAEQSLFLAQSHAPNYIKPQLKHALLILKNPNYYNLNDLDYVYRLIKSLRESGLPYGFGERIAEDLENGLIVFKKEKAA